MLSLRGAADVWEGAGPEVVDVQVHNLGRLWGQRRGPCRMEIPLGSNVGSIWGVFFFFFFFERFPLYSAK
jgi:hypothetical protein